MGLFSFFKKKHDKKKPTAMTSNYGVSINPKAGNDTVEILKKQGMTETDKTKSSKKKKQK